MLSLRHIEKRFGSTVAVDDVSLEITPGEIVGLVGENGAGKTTLMRIAAGEIAPDRGTVQSTGKIGFVHQHFILVNDFTIAENLALHGITDVAIDLGDRQRRVGDLSVGERSKLELAKAVARRPAVLILDEPTSVLTPIEAEELFAVMRRFASEGTSVVFISHKIAEVIAVATRTVVMRKGKIVAEGTGMSAEQLARAMVDLKAAALPPHSKGIVAIIGVAGNGQAEHASHLRDTLKDAGFIPEDRTRDGIIAEMSIAENLALRTSVPAETLIAQYDIRARDANQLAGTLSGGNQQKLILARELSREPDFIVAAEPTRGLDLEATRFVHDRLRAAAERGASIVLITSDLDEAFSLGDAIQVIYRGKLSERMTPEEARERAGRLMAGLA